MSSILERAVLYPVGSFEQICGHCGCRLLVDVMGKIGNADKQYYDCLECAQPFVVQAAVAPEITLLSPRDDGKTNKYPKPRIVDADDANAGRRPATKPKPEQPSP